MLELTLGLLVLLFSSSLLHLVLEESIHAFNAEFPIPMDFSMPFELLIYLHIVFIKSPKRVFKRMDLLHFIPSLLFDVSFFTSFFLYIRFNIEWAYDNLQFIQQLALSISIVGILQLIVYAILTYKEAKSAQLSLKEFKSISQWLKYILIAVIVFIGFVVIVILLALLNIEKFDDNTFLIYKPLGIIIGFCIYGLGDLYLLKYIKVVGHCLVQIIDFQIFKCQEFNLTLYPNLRNDCC